MPSAGAQVMTWTRAKASLSIFVVSAGISLFTAAYERAVSPLFGSVATTTYTKYVVHASTILAIVLPKPPRSLLLPSIATLVQAAPHTTYWVSVFAARGGDPLLGSLVTHAAVLSPVIYLTVSLATSIDFTFATLALVANGLQLRPLISFVTHHLSPDTHEDVLFLVLGGIASLWWTLESLAISQLSSRVDSASNAISIARKFWAMLIPAILFLFPALRSPTLSSSAIFPYENRNYPFRILSSRDSVTGVVVVGELVFPATEVADPTATYNIRYLRASHSLLGGVWIGPHVASLGGVLPRTDHDGTPLGDSIYNTFVLQEAARFAGHNLPDDVGEREDALIIGLGAGISADAFIRHGIHPIIVEIDPAVYDAARKYFGLSYPGDDHVFLEDARQWVFKRRAAMQSDQKISTFDIVIHDCFSGGGVPEHLFSVEFWNDLKSIMRPNGIVAVNFAGRFGSQSTRAVATTLLRVFGQCRVFHDLSNPIPEDEFYTDFLNMVFFCSPSSYPLTFRPAAETDYLHSYLRREILSSLARREVPIAQLKGTKRSEDTGEQFVLTDANNTLGTWQREDALEHWKLMRKILPNIVWETY